MESADLSLRFPNELSAIDESCAAVVRFLQPLGTSARTLHRAEVIVEELVSNLVRHGDGVGMLDVHASLHDGQIRLVIEDDGEPFDPFERPDPRPFTSLEKAELGGLGILLVRRFSTSCDYERVGERNRVTLLVANA